MKRAVCLAAVLTGSAAFGQVDFGPNVVVLEPGDPGAQATVDGIFAKQEKAEFGTGRYAILLKPGVHELKAPVGFYTEVAGVGMKPDEVEVRGYVRSKAYLESGNATCNFWRAVENLAIVPAGETELEKTTDVWAVSQATAMRRVHVKGNLNLWDGGWSSGGFLADCKVDGVIKSGSQQQWMSRNTDLGKWEGGSWNMVFVGCEHEPEGEWPGKPYTKVEKTPVVREKPFLVWEKGEWGVRVPGLGKDVRGVTWEAGEAAGKTVPMSEFFVARPGRDDAAAINAALAGGKHVLLTPGTYVLSEPLKVTRAGTIVMGLGYATLRASNGTAAVEVADVSGVTLAGLLVEGGDKESPALVQVGTAGSRADHGADPTFVFDVFCRTGGEINGKVKALVTVNSNSVVGDNLWLWRADHGEGAGWGSNTTANGLVVKGDDVTMYGLFVEHTTEYQVLWEGERGRTYFYQSEMPYDPPSQAAWMSPGGAGEKKGWASYKVADGVKAHEAWGLGIYSVFFGAPVVVDSPVEVPEALEGSMHHLVTARFAGKPGSGFVHVINDKGGDVIKSKWARVK